MQGYHNLLKFQEQVKQAPTDKSCERIVRIMLEEVSKDCPMHVLVKLGECLCECRRQELGQIESG